MVETAPARRIPGPVAAVASGVVAGVMAAVVLGSLFGPFSPVQPLRAFGADQTATRVLRPRAVSAGVAGAVRDAARDNGVLQWAPGKVTLSVGGTPTVQDQAMVAATAAELSELIGRRVAMVNQPDADIAVRFRPRASWPVAEGDNVYGVTRSRWDSRGRMAQADVYVDTDQGQAQRNLTIVHELMHAVGIGHTSCKSSVVYGDGDGSPSWRLGALDTAVTRTWYRLAPGRLPRSALAVRDDVGGPACDAPQWEAVASEATTYWCRIGPEPRGCVPVDGTALPDDASEVTRWLHQGFLSDYDPTRYQAFSVEGRRLLCTLGEGRQPCAWTDGAGPVDGADAWLDGGALVAA